AIFRQHEDLRAASLWILGFDTTDAPLKYLAGQVARPKLDGEILPEVERVAAEVQIVPAFRALSVVVEAGFTAVESLDRFLDQDGQHIIAEQVVGLPADQYLRTCDI